MKKEITKNVKVAARKEWRAAVKSPLAACHIFNKVCELQDMVELKKFAIECGMLVVKTSASGKTTTKRINATLSHMAMNHARKIEDKAVISRGIRVKNGAFKDNILAYMQLIESAVIEIGTETFYTYGASLYRLKPVSRYTIDSCVCIFDTKRQMEKATLEGCKIPNNFVALEGFAKLANDGKIAEIAEKLEYKL